MVCLEDEWSVVIDTLHSETGWSRDERDVIDSRLLLFSSNTVNVLYFAFQIFKNLLSFLLAIFLIYPLDCLLILLKLKSKLLQLIKLQLSHGKQYN